MFKNIVVLSAVIIIILGSTSCTGIIENDKLEELDITVDIVNHLMDKYGDYFRPTLDNENEATEHIDGNGNVDYYRVTLECSLPYNVKARKWKDSGNYEDNYITCKYADDMLKEVRIGIEKDFRGWRYDIVNYLPCALGAIQDKDTTFEDFCKLNNEIVNIDLECNDIGNIGERLKSLVGNFKGPRYFSLYVYLPIGTNKDGLSNIKLASIEESKDEIERNSKTFRELKDRDILIVKLERAEDGTYKIVGDKLIYVKRQ